MTKLFLTVRSALKESELSFRLYTHDNSHYKTEIIEFRGKEFIRRNS